MNLCISPHGRLFVEAALDSDEGAPERITEAFTENTVRALMRMRARPAGADPLVTAQFLVGGVLGVIGAWLAGQPPGWSADQVVEALIHCLPSWLNAD